MESREQRLVNLCFEFALKGAALMHGKSNEEVAAWVAENLRECGFPTKPVGSSWGILQESPPD